MKKKKNKLKIGQPIYFIFKFKIFWFTKFNFICIMYIMNFHIQSLSLEIKNLLPLVELLEKNQCELKNQLLIRDQQVKILENTVETLNTNVAALSYFNDTKNFEVLRYEVINANT